MQDDTHVHVLEADDPVARAFRQYLAALRAHRAKRVLLSSRHPEDRLNKRDYLQTIPDPDASR